MPDIFRDKIDAILSDGQWHPMTQFIIAASECFPPEVAARTYATSRRKGIRGNPIALEARIRLGMSRIAEKRLNGIKRNHGKASQIEIRGKGPLKEYRKVLMGCKDLMYGLHDAAVYDASHDGANNVEAVLKGINPADLPSIITMLVEFSKEEGRLER